MRPCVPHRISPQLAGQQFRYGSSRASRQIHLRARTSPCTRRSSVCSRCRYPRVRNDTNRTGFRVTILVVRGCGAGWGLRNCREKAVGCRAVRQGAGGYRPTTTGGNFRCAERSEVLQGIPRAADGQAVAAAACGLLRPGPHLHVARATGFACRGCHSWRTGAAQVSARGGDDRSAAILADQAYGSSQAADIAETALNWTARRSQSCPFSSGFSRSGRLEKPLPYGASA